MTKQEKIEELVDYIVESMDMSDLEAYAKQQLEEYYSSPEGANDLDLNYSDMQEVRGLLLDE